MNLAEKAKGFWKTHKKEVLIIGGTIVGGTVWYGIGRSIKAVQDSVPSLSPYTSPSPLSRALPCIDLGVGQTECSAIEDESIRGFYVDVFDITVGDIKKVGEGLKHCVDGVTDDTPTEVIVRFNRTPLY